MSKVRKARRGASRRHSGAAKGAAGSGRVRLLEGDCLEVLGQLEPKSVDAVVTDPPYGIGFQHQRWDSAAIREAAARHGHKRMSASEAFEAWCRIWAAECQRVMKPGAFLAAFGSPRTYHRLACGLEDAGLEMRDTLMWIYGKGMPKSRRYPGGRATTLKPAFEPIVLARRRLSGTTEETLSRFDTGALCVEECRTNGRFPANVIVGHAPGCKEGCCVKGCAVALVDEDTERTRTLSGSRTPPSRFFYCPKVSRTERDAGCERLPSHSFDLLPNAPGQTRRCGSTRNPHPTVKPLALMRWLVRLLCPEGSLVLDPFCGSGTTGAAAAIEGRRFVGIELEPAYMEIAAARIAHWSPGRRRAEVEGGPFGRRQ